MARPRSVVSDNMDLTPEVLHSQEFREARRGYDMREVDEFLERVAVAVEKLLGRLRTATEDAEGARSRIGTLEEEVQKAKLEVAVGPDETIQRTLLLAQRTADAAIAEAEEKASSMLSRAEQQTAFILREAEESAERSRIEAESQARRAGEETRRRMLEEITNLERTREVMHSDVRALRRYLDDQRTRMRTAARDLQRLVEDPTALKDHQPPVTSDHVDDDTDRRTGDDQPDQTDHVEVPSEDDAVAAPGEVEDLTDADEDADYLDDLRRAMNEEGASEPSEL